MWEAMVFRSLVVTVGWSADSASRRGPGGLRPVERRSFGPPGRAPCPRWAVGRARGRGALVDRSVDLVRVMTGCQFALDVAPLRSRKREGDDEFGAEVPYASSPRRSGSPSIPCARIGGWPRGGRRTSGRRRSFPRCTGSWRRRRTRTSSSRARRQRADGPRRVERGRGEAGRGLVDRDAGDGGREGGTSRTSRPTRRWRRWRRPGPAH